MVNCIGVRTDRYVNKHIFTIYCILVYLCIVQFLTLLKGIISSTCIALFIFLLLACNKFKHSPQHVGAWSAPNSVTSLTFACVDSYIFPFIYFRTMRKPRFTLYYICLLNKYRNIYRTTDTRAFQNNSNRLKEQIILKNNMRKPYRLRSNDAI